MTIPKHVLAIATLVLAAAVAAPVHAQPPDEVDQTLLVPTTLDSSFAPFICKAKRTGPVCKGERHIVTDWALADWPCGLPVYGAYREDRWTTRFYNTDYLNYDRMFRTHNIDYLSTAGTGPATATIRTDARFREPFEVPGDDSTFTIITTGTILDIRSVGRDPVFRAVGTLVEPPDAAPTFTGRVTVDGVRTSYDDASLDAFLSDDAFVDFLCRAVTGT